MASVTKNEIPPTPIIKQEKGGALIFRLNFGLPTYHYGEALKQPGKNVDLRLPGTV